MVTSGVVRDLRLAWMMGRRDLRNRYAASIAGAAWLVGVPLLYAVINVFVFSILMSGKMGERYGDVPFSLFYFSAFTVWTLFSEVMNRSTSILREYAYLINKIAFPVWVLPLVAFASALLTQLIVLGITVALMFWYGRVPSHALVLYPVVWACTVILTMGLCYGVSAVSVFIPDMAQVVPVCVSILFFLSPILYPPSLVEASAGGWAKRILMDWNPFFYLVEAARAALIGTGPFPWRFLAVAGIAALISALGGALLFNRLKKGFADVL